MAVSTPETRTAAFARALDSLRISGFTIDGDLEFIKLKDAYIDGTLTIEMLLEETHKLTRRAHEAKHGV